MNASFLDLLDVSEKPFCLPDVEIDSDRRSAANLLMNLGLEPKASSLATCNLFYVPILEYKDHWARVGQATCHLKFACIDCGTGVNRAHRLISVAPNRYHKITQEVTRTIRLTLYHDTNCNSLAEYVQRVKADKLRFSRIRKKYLLGGSITAIEPDPEMRNVTFRVYHVGEIANKQWEKVGASCRIAWDSPVDALRWVLDGYGGILKLAGEIRALWEVAFNGCRLTSNCGTLRGINTDEPHYEKLSGNAPYGYCPCGCGGVVTKAVSHKAKSGQSLDSGYKLLSFGPLKDYEPYSPKGEPAYRFSPEMMLLAAHPPPG